MADYSIKGSLRIDKGIKKNGKFSIGLRVNVHGKETKVSTKLEVEQKDWDSNSQMPKPKAVLSEFLKLVNALDDHLYSEGRLGEEISIQSVKDFYAGKKRIKPEHQSFYEYLHEFLKRRSDLKPNTTKVYKTTLGALKQFRPQFRIADITLKFVEDFDAFLKSVRNNKDGGRNNRHKNLKTLVNDMIDHGINIPNPYNLFRMPMYGKKDIYLEEDEIQRLYQLQIKFDRDSYARISLYMFLLACFTGFRISDIKDLKWSDIDYEKKQIKKRMVKTEGKVVTVLYEKAWRLLIVIASVTGNRAGKKNLGTERLIFEKIPSEPTINKYLKKLAQMAEIPKEVSFHVSRHTFATLHQHNGTDIYIISKLLGHSSITVTQRYLNGTEKMISDYAKTSKMFK